MKSVRGDGVLAGVPIFEVLPKREAVFTADFLEADKGVATSPSSLTTGSGADFTLLFQISFSLHEIFIKLNTQKNHKSSKYFNQYDTCFP